MGQHASRYVPAVADNTLGVDPQEMRWCAQSLLAAAEELRNQLADLDGQVGDMLGGWRGASGSAYTAAWELWHCGAGEVETGLSILARAIAEADGSYQQNEAGAAQAMRAVRDG